MNPPPHWSRRFDEPIRLSDGSQIETLRDALKWLIDRTPKSEYGTPDIAAAARTIKDAAEKNGSMSMVTSEIRRLAARQEAAFLVPELEIGFQSPFPVIVKGQDLRSNPPPRSVPNLGFGRFLHDQRLLWRRRLRAPAPPKNKEPSLTDPAVLELLTKLRDAGGTLYWKETRQPALEGLEQALQLGLIVRLSGPSHEGVTLTRRGRTAIGIGRTLSFSGWVALRLSHLQEKPFSIANLYRLPRDALVLDSLPPFQKLISVILDPYRKLIQRLPLRRFRKHRNTPVQTIGENGTHQRPDQPDRS
jgi:hypothetical protein